MKEINIIINHECSSALIDTGANIITFINPTLFRNPIPQSDKRVNMVDVSNQTISCFKSISITYTLIGLNFPLEGSKCDTLSWSHVFLINCGAFINVLDYDSLNIHNAYISFSSNGKHFLRIETGDQKFQIKNHPYNVPGFSTNDVKTLPCDWEYEIETENKILQEKREHWNKGQRMVNFFFNLPNISVNSRSRAFA